MRINVNLKDELINHAAKLTGINEKTALINAGLEALIAKYSRERLASLGGSDKRARTIPRRRLKSS
jgi:Arc/MetJ family transcription regulator